MHHDQGQMRPEELVPHNLLVVRRWLQRGLSLDPEAVASSIMDETDGRWGFHRVARGRPVENRLTVRFGEPGVTSTLGLRRQQVFPFPGPGVLRSLSQVLTGYLSLSAAPLNFCYCNIYSDGTAGISKHCDRGFLELAAHATIASLSFGQPRKFQLWSKIGPSLACETVLEPGDLAVMHGSCQLDFMHAVPRERGVEMPRLSLTFRHHKILPPELVRRAVKLGREKRRS